MTNPYFFGYGSLVNLATHAYHNPQPARLSGWRRAWVHTDLSKVAVLTAVPCADSIIDGVIAAVPGADWEALDAREYCYDRLPAKQSVQHEMPEIPDISVYAVPAVSHGSSAKPCPILLSYLDVVVQGYDQLFGAKGVESFFTTTDGWDAPILNDRHAPKYPRHQPLETAQRTLVDQYLETYDATVIAAE